MTNDVVVPYKYSCIGHFTSLYMLIPVYFSYKIQNYLISLVSLYLYITTNLYWYNLKDGFIKNLDVSAVYLFSIVTAIETYRKYKYFYIYWVISFINICIFIFNKHVNYKIIIDNIKNKVKTEPSVYIELVAIHVLTLHIAQMIALFFVLFF